VGRPDRDIQIRHVLEPGDLGMVIHLHGVLYAREYGLDTTFEPYVAKPLAEFAMSGEGRLWIAAEGGHVVGSVAMVDAPGRGLGRRLLETVLDYARERHFARVFLWTFAGLGDALRLYERAGFKVTETKTGPVWGAERTEVRMEMSLTGA
jgi:GNAT superfamily N-acetyltransferase